jgi:DNA-binding NtrC family response regulator
LGIGWGRVLAELEWEDRIQRVRAPPGENISTRSRACYHSPVPIDARKSPARTPRILIVDDDAGQRSLLKSFLSGQGFEIQPVESGERALEVLRGGGFNMMISDVRMPGLSGLETLRLVRAEHPVLPVLLVTAYADIREAVGAMRDGALNYLAKPIDLDELLANVRLATGVAKPSPPRFAKTSWP